MGKPKTEDGYFEARSFVLVWFDAGDFPRCASFCAFFSCGGCSRAKKSQRKLRWFRALRMRDGGFYNTYGSNSNLE